MRIFFLLFFCSCLSIGMFGQETDLFLKKHYVSGNDTLPYRILFPENYDENQSYPLVLFLHGSGERGSDNELQLVHGAKLFLDSENRKNFPAFVVFPQCPSQASWAVTEVIDSEFFFPFKEKPSPAMELLIGLLDELQENLPIDPQRQYLGGLSMGGFGTFDLLARQPKRFAASFPICGGGNPLLTNLYAPNTALWIFHGAEDKVVPPGASRRVVQSLEKNQAAFRYTEYPFVKHESWDSAFAEPDLLPWLFSHKLHLPKDRYLKQVFTGVNMRTMTYTRDANESLALDYYWPEEEQNVHRPLILYVHGGGFSGGQRDELRYTQFARRMARRGFSVASISYRLTMRGKSFSCDQATKNKIKTFKYATEDIWKATNFLIKRADQLGIDKSKIILAGSSAGAEAVLHASYWEKEDLSDLKTNTSLPDEFKYAGVISMAGAILDTNMINKENAIPTLLFHGTCDDLVPFGTAPHHYCDEGEKGYMILHGANSIAKRMHHLDASYWMVAQCGGAHEWNDRPLFDFVQPMSEAILNMMVNGKKWQNTIRTTGDKTCKINAATKCEDIFEND